MRNNILFIPAIFLFLLSLSVSYAQSKQELLSKNWQYSGVEEFGVVKTPDSTLKNDQIGLKADGTFIMVKNGKKSEGIWTYNEKAGTISLTNSKTKKSLAYQLKSVDDKILVIEFQTPDLVRTRYHYEAIMH